MTKCPRLRLGSWERLGSCVCPDAIGDASSLQPLGLALWRGFLDFSLTTGACMVLVPHVCIQTDQCGFCLLCTASHRPRKRGVEDWVHSYSHRPRFES